LKNVFYDYVFYHNSDSSLLFCIIFFDNKLTWIWNWKLDCV